MLNFDIRGIPRKVMMTLLSLLLFDDTRYANIQHPPNTVKKDNWPHKHVPWQLLLLYNPPPFQQMASFPASTSVASSSTSADASAADHTLEELEAMVEELEKMLPNLSESTEMLLLKWCDGVLLLVVMLQGIVKVSQSASMDPLLVRRLDHLLMCVCEASQQWKSYQWPPKHIDMWYKCHRPHGHSLYCCFGFSGFRAWMLNFIIQISA